MEIIVDTREQLPLWTRYKRQCLPVGDYTTTLLQNSFVIERKSPQDLYGSIIQGHVRFMNELIRAKIMGIKIVVYVECTKKIFIEKKFAGGIRRSCPGKTLEKIINTIQQRKELEIVWCSSRNSLKDKVKKRLQEEESKYKLYERNKQ